ncbi:protein ILRUN [Neocloeon triangulifer]|uniref:protein ILRUN n=1 Tax=Neocloeon triangulifer TaxID=2078957 RepID=UPI00286F0C4C|nr:protein ILRUN [Neocloeon triangulifer]
MEVDGDLDQDLLQQFSCMGTTDKDTLISQLQKLVGNLSSTAAAFFLDMNNWNLQAAVGSYFDYEAANNLPSMSLVKDATVGDGESVPPCTRFTKTWKLRNNGDMAWPEGCYLKHTYGEQWGGLSERISLPSISPGQEVEINIELISPSKNDIYYSNWRACTANGSYFGDTIWVVITVADGGTLALTQQLTHLSDLGSSPLGMSNVPNPFTPFLQNQPSQPLFQDSVPPQDPGDNPNRMC